MPRSDVPSCRNTSPILGKTRPSLSTGLSIRGQHRCHTPFPTLRPKGELQYKWLVASPGASLKQQSTAKASAPVCFACPKGSFPQTPVLPRTPEPLRCIASSFTSAVQPCLRPGDLARQNTRCAYAYASCSFTMHHQGPPVERLE